MESKMRQLEYQRNKVLDYAKKWAFGRNPAYLDFENLGGDCTNFASQCIYAGSQVMNPTKVYGWYYYSSTNRTASWTGVQYLYNFLTKNKGVGPYAAEVKAEDAVPGDILQLGTSGGFFYHSPVIVKVTDQNIYVAAHTFDAYLRPLDSYIYEEIRFLHILGVRGY
nr:amidase domain-containing protein [Robinsoniella sp. KNHs210]